MTKARQYLSALVLLSLGVLLSGCKMALLQPQGAVAADEKHILVQAVLLMLIVVVPVLMMTFWFAWRYRASNKKACYKPNWAHNNWIEVVCWAIPCVIIVILGYITWVSTHQLDPYRPLDMKGKPLTVQVVALEWKWLFIYPEQGIASVNYVQFPVNKQVKFLITSEGPMNSLQIPELAGQIYAMAGMQTKLHFVANKIGEYRGMSTNFSGDGFSGMKFIAHASTEKEFKQWVRKTRLSQNKLTMHEYNILLKPSQDVPAKFYVLKDKTIYKNAIMKYMMPMGKDKKGMHHAG